MIIFPPIINPLDRRVPRTQNFGPSNNEWQTEFVTTVLLCRPTNSRRLLNRISARFPQIGIAFRQRHSRLSAKEMAVPRVPGPIVHRGGQRGREHQPRAGPAGRLRAVRSRSRGSHVRRNCRQSRVAVVVVPVVRTTGPPFYRSPPPLVL